MQYVSGCCTIPIVTDENQVLPISGLQEIQNQIHLITNQEFKLQHGVLWRLYRELHSCHKKLTQCHYTQKNKVLTLSMKYKCGT
jgi:hypothetical protein